jgi:hypothetical protein
VLEPKITQLYASEAAVARGEKSKICYGVENAKSVSISPGADGGARQELLPALAQCVEVQPAGTTTYTLTAEGADGKHVSQEVKIGIGPGKVKIVNVNVSSAAVKPGETVSICYTVAHARSVTIAPVGYKGGANAKGCAEDRPAKSTTYTITATGATGDRDEERVTITVGR